MESLEEKIGRLESCTIALKHPYNDLLMNLSRADGANSVDSRKGENFLASAEKSLAEMEDIIKRYRNGELQNFEKVD